MAPPKRTHSKRTDTAAASNGNKKAKTNSLASQRVITLLVGDNQAQFNIHADHLIANSVVIKHLIDEYNTEQETKPIILSDVTRETFDTFATWIYAKKLPTDGVVVEELEEAGDCALSDNDSVRGNESNGGSVSNGDVDEEEEIKREEDNESVGTPEQGIDQTQDTPRWDANLNREGRVFGRLVDAFVFATHYGCAAFRRAVMLQLQRSVYNYEMVPCPTVVERALDNLDLDTPLCRYLIVCYGHYTDYGKMSKTRVATLPSKFLAEVIDIAFKRIDGDEPSTSDDWCEFHEHQDESERDECEDERENDPDVIEKKRIQRGPRSFMARMGGCC